MTENDHSPCDIADFVYHSVFRTEFTQPGFALMNLGPDYGSESQRRLMIDLKNEFDRLERRHRGQNLVYQSLTRFDQQVTTKPHRDGDPSTKFRIVQTVAFVLKLFSQRGRSQTNQVVVVI